MIAINYGLYDSFGEIEYGAATAKSSTALELIKEDLIEYLQSEIEECERNSSQSWAVDNLKDLTDALIEINSISTMDQFIESDLFHYEEWELSGKFDKEL